MRKWRITWYNQSKPERNNYHCYIKCASQVVKKSKWFLQCQHEFMHQQTRGWNYQLCYKILTACHKYAIIVILVLSFLFFGALSVTLLLRYGNFAQYSSHNTGQNGFHVSHINIKKPFYISAVWYKYREWHRTKVVIPLIVFLIQSQSLKGKTTCWEWYKWQLHTRIIAGFCCSMAPMSLIHCSCCSGGTTMTGVSLPVGSMGNITSASWRHSGQ